MAAHPISLNSIYELRENFMIIGLTGRMGSGCSVVSDLLKTSEDNLKNVFPQYHNTISPNNEQRKYKIARQYFSENWRPFDVIKYTDVILLFILQQSLNSIVTYLRNYTDEPLSSQQKLELYSDYLHPYSPEANELNEELSEIHEQIRSKHKNVIKNLERKTPRHLKELHNLYFNSEDFNSYKQKFHACLTKTKKANRIKILQLLSNNIRRCGNPILESVPDPKHVYSVAKVINRLIKAYRQNHHADHIARIVVHSLRNALEIMFFKERYSGFYMVAVNSSEEDCRKILKDKFDPELEEIIKIDEQEYSAKGKSYFEQDVSNCIQRADIHLAMSSDDNEKNSIKHQIVKYISLVLHPGIITPTPEERTMQLAYTAKYNSGCISRQVGAVITDQFYSVKAIGWNNTAEGQVPCLLRNADDLLNGKDDGAFSKYEKTDSKFRKEFEKHYAGISKQKFKGHNCSFCFKEVQNSITEGKNQVHTRSLHAEENAFLQITKYGGTSIKDGKLFTTASPCELCSKKAYQLGIKEVYYIDPYPGIAQDHILNIGSESDKPKMKLFSGAIGRAYHKLYEPFMAYKDEIKNLTGLKIEDVTTQLNKENRELKDKVKTLEIQMDEFQRQLSEYEEKNKV